MKRKSLRRLILMGMVVLTGLMIVQVYWFRKAFDIQEKQLDHRVQVALMRVADSVSTGAEVKRLSSNFYFVAAETALDGHAIDSLVASEFMNRNIVLDYELGVYNAEDDTLVYGQYVEAARKSTLASHMTPTDGARNFALYFPGKQTYIISQLDIWVFSTVALIFMMGFFAWSIVTLLKERRFHELKNDFIDNMTHEFKTPVTNIGIIAEILKKKLPDDNGLTVYLNILTKENENLKEKIERVLLGASADERKPSMDKINIHQLIMDCAESFQLKIRERNGNLRLQLDAKNSFILGDRDLLAQAFNNVIDNAEKYSPATPEISVNTCDSGEAIEIEIRDCGVGVPEKLQTRVFDKFFRAQQGDVHNVKGFGLGLSFVKGVVRSHRGQVQLSSDHDQGTKVRIILPKA